MLTALVVLILLTGLDHRFFGGESGLVSFSLAELVSYTLLVFLFLDFCAQGGRHRSVVRSVLASANPFVLPYFTWALVSAGANLAMGNRDALHSLKDTVPAFAMFMGLTLIIVDRHKLALAHRAVLLMLALVSCLAVSQYLVGGPYPTEINPNAYLKVTLTGASFVAHPVVGTLGHPNGLAELLAPLLVLCVGYVAHRRGRVRGIEHGLFLGIIGLSAVALILTQAKAALAWAVVGIFLTTLFAWFRTPFSPKLGVLVAGVLIIAAVGGLTVLLLVTGMVPESLRPGTLATRLLINYSAFEEAWHSPTVLAFGGGLTLFGESVAGATLKLGVHGEYLSALLRFGLPGTFLLISLLVAGIRVRGGSGWLYSLPSIVLILVYLLESAAGSQLQTLPFLLCGFAEANRVVTAMENPFVAVAEPPAIDV